jgi:hypothetical protein
MGGTFFGAPMSGRFPVSPLRASFPAALGGIIAHRSQLQGQGLMVMRRDPGVQPSPHDLPGQKPLLEWPVENLDFAGVPMLVGLLAINYSFLAEILREQLFSRQQVKRDVALTEEDLVQIGKCRRPHNRLGFAYQVAFIRLFNRLPVQQPFEVVDELVSLSAAQLGFDARQIELYRKWQPTISEHQQIITDYLGLHPFGDAEAARLEQFVFEESWHLEQAAALKPRRRNFLRNSASSNLLSSGSSGSSASSVLGLVNTSSGGLLRRCPPT